MGDAGEVRWERRGSTAFITFDRPSARNALTPSMYERLAELIERAAGESGLRTLVLRGAGGTFVAGSDITQFRAFASAEDGVAYERRIDATVGALEALAVPTIAVVEGVAAGAGLLLAAACDLRLCTPDARFGVPIARTVGNTLSAASTALLVAHLGPARATALLFLAEFMTADDAQQAGFVYDVVDPEKLDARIDGLCDRIAQHAPVTLAVSKEAIRRVLAADVPDEDLIRRAYGSRDFREGVDAFLSKRPPHWTGE
jgi:enoyl-CoA hydratase/carnithine racemase